MPALDLTGFLVAVSTVCCEFRGSVTSWWRTRSHNAAVGGVHASKHEIGAACDIVYDQGSAPTLEAVRDLLFAGPGCRVIREKDHDHIELVLTVAGPDAVAIAGTEVPLAS